MFFGRRDAADRPHPVALVRDSVEILAIIAAGVWAVSTFLYNERIKPAADHEIVTPSVSVEVGPERGGVVPLTVHRTYVNNAHIALRVLATDDVVLGRRVDRAHRLKPGQAAFAVTPWQAVRERRTLYAPQGNSFTLNPGEVDDARIVVWMPARDFDQVRVYARVAYTRYVDTPPRVHEGSSLARESLTLRELLCEQPQCYTNRAFTDVTLWR